MDRQDGELAVRVARLTVDAETAGCVLKMPHLTKAFDEPKGVFVTVKNYPDMSLRGCIGYPEPFFKLRDSLTRSAISACHDPRFPDLTSDEADNVVIEVTILTVPKVIDVPKNDLPSAIEVGRDGLIIELGARRGLLLPQVPVEWGWDVTEYLENLSMKARLPSDAWKDEDARISAFSGEVFRERIPRGEVI